MRSESRFVVILSALLWTLFVSATLLRHWAGTPSRGMSWLLLAPIVATALMALGVGCELGHIHHRGGLEIVHWSEVQAVARASYFVGFALLSWRAIWMFFSWDGMYLFPAWL